MSERSLLLALIKPSPLTRVLLAGRQLQESSSSSPSVSSHCPSGCPVCYLPEAPPNACPVVIAFFTLFIPSSPRWLLSKDREDDAVASLRQLRPKGDSANGNCEAEIRVIREQLQGDVHKGPWLDLFRGNNFRRTMIVMVFYFFQQVSASLFCSTLVQV